MFEEESQVSSTTCLPSVEAERNRVQKFLNRQGWQDLLGRRFVPTNPKREETIVELPVNVEWKTNQLLVLLEVAVLGDPEDFRTWSLKLALDEFFEKSVAFNWMQILLEDPELLIEVIWTKFEGKWRSFLGNFDHGYFRKMRNKIRIHSPSNGRPRRPVRRRGYRDKGEYEVNSSKRLREKILSDSDSYQVSAEVVEVLDLYISLKHEIAGILYLTEVRELRTALIFALLNFSKGDYITMSNDRTIQKIEIQIEELRSHLEGVLKKQENLKITQQNLEKKIEKLEQKIEKIKGTSEAH